MGGHKGRNQMSRLSKYVKEKIVKVLVAADVLGTASLSNPYSFAVYANEYTEPNHVEGNVAIGTLKAHVDTWRYCSYVGEKFLPEGIERYK